MQTNRGQNTAVGSLCASDFGAEMPLPSRFAKIHSVVVRVYDDYG